MFNVILQYVKNIFFYHKNGKEINSMFISADFKADFMINLIDFSSIIGTSIKLAKE